MTMPKRKKKFRPISSDTQKDIRIVDIPDDCTPIKKGTKAIAQICVKDANGEIIRTGEFHKTCKGGYTFH